MCKAGGVRVSVNLQTIGKRKQVPSVRIFRQLPTADSFTMPPFIRTFINDDSITDLPVANTKPIKAICFDLDDTLWDSKPTFQLATDALFEFIGKNFPRMILARGPAEFFELMKQLHADIPECTNFTVCRKMALKITAIEAGYDYNDVVEPAYQVYDDARQQVRLYDGVLQTLLRLKQQGLILLALSNGNADLSRIPCLKNVFDVIVNPATCKASKPSLHPFNEAMRLAGVKSSEIVHVGDDYLADMVGAKNAGLHTIWVHNTSCTPDSIKHYTKGDIPCIEKYLDGSAADCEISDMFKLDIVLKSWGLLADAA